MALLDNITLVMWYSLLGVGVFYLILGWDDVLFDIIYWIRHHYNKHKHWIRGFKRLTVKDLLAVPEKPIAVLIGCWDESKIINLMLNHNVENIHYNNYDIFVGVYPNDPQTVEEVKKAASQFPHIKCVIGHEPGPTTKSKNLNIVFDYIKSYEKENNKQYEIFVLHDAEDLIHPLSFKLYNYMIPRKDMVQLPLYPLRPPLWDFTQWVYNDEFIEGHTKDIIARETLGGHVPSAGVGTGFARHVFYALEQHNNNRPFHDKTHTEDYSISLQIHRLNFKSIFMTQGISQIVEKKPWYFLGFRKPIHKEIQQHVVTRSLFPNHYRHAVRQRSRWILGIALQEWIHSNWDGGWATKLTLFRDRKGLISFAITGLGYLLRVYWLFHVFIIIPLFPDALTLATLLARDSWAYYLILACTILMVNRMVQKVIVTTRIYGFIPGLLSIPRMYWSNIINCHAVVKSLKVFFWGEGKKGKNKWLKTSNRFPSQEHRIKHKHRLGDLLLNRGLTSTEHLKQALQEQTKTHQPLGKILLQHQWVEEDPLLHILAEQHSVETVNISKNVVLSKTKLPFFSTQEYTRLIKIGILPISLTQHSLLMVSSEVVDKQRQFELKKKTHPLKVHFLTITPHQKEELLQNSQLKNKGEKK